MGKKFWLVGAMVFFISSLAWAHPPVSMDVQYERATRQFRATIAHPVHDPVKHFIRQITIQLNGRQIAQEQLTKQSTTQEQQILFQVEQIKSGDVMDLEAFCNVGGRIKQRVRIK